LTDAFFAEVVAVLAVVVYVDAAVVAAARACVLDLDDPLVPPQPARTTVRASATTAARIHRRAGWCVVGSAEKIYSCVIEPSLPG
jgi:hypothetical protein